MSINRSRDHNQSWSIKTDFSNKTFFPNGLWRLSKAFWRMTSRSRTLRESQNQRNFDQKLRFSSLEKISEQKSVNFARYTTQYRFKPGPKSGPGSKSNPFLPCLRQGSAKIFSSDSFLNLISWREFSPTPGLRSLLPDDGAGRCSLPRLKQKGNRQ